jgi:methyl-accepting chemotaxis protein
MSDTQTVTPPPRSRPAPPTTTDPIWRSTPSRAPAVSTDTVTTRAVPAAADRPSWLRFRLGLLAKIILFLAAVLVPLAAITAYVSVDALREKMTQEFTSKGSAIASRLASSSEDLIINRDASTVQSEVDRVAEIGGVAYVIVYDPQRTLIAHTLSPVVPAGLIEQNMVPGDVRAQVRPVRFTHPDKGAMEIIDIGVPMLAGILGTVRVGMDKTIIDATVTQTAGWILAVFGGVAALAVLVAVFFARRITRPIARLVRTAQRVGQGDLSQTVPVTSGDEIGQLSETFNNSIVRLRSLVQTEAERDDEKRKREELQRNITRFLDTVTEVSQGDLTKRGEVTSDVLGNVVDAINVMVEEIGTIIGDVRQAALRVSRSSQEMIASSGQMATGAQAQSREAKSMAGAVEELTASVRQVAKIAEDSAGAARRTLEASQKGDQAVRNSLDGMQRIRGEVQSISKKIKSLGDRSLEISAIVNTIEEIASQTNLLALNAAIEAAGAGEAGLRFAVVADEVRKLAERSAKATKDIAALIRSVQAETHEAIVVMEQGTQEVEAGYRVTVQAGDSLKDIATISEKSAELAQDISRATQHQVRGAESVATAVKSIAGVAVQTEQGVLHGRRTVDELARLAEELTANLSRFKLASS